MPQEVEINGEKKTVYFEDEVKPLQASHDEVGKLKESLGKFQTELGVEAGQPLETVFEKVKEMKEAANPNWQEARSVIKSLKGALKEKGVEVDDKTGQVKSNPKGVSPEEIQKMIDDGISKGISGATFKINKDGALGSYNAEDRAKLEPVLDKLMALGGTIDENLSLAEAKVFPGRQMSATRRVYNSAVGGGAAIAGEEGNKFSESQEGKNLGKAMGLSAFQEKPKK